MAIYVGGQKHKFILDGKVFGFNIPIPPTITKNAKLLSSQSYILKDADDVYLTFAEIIQLLDSEDSILTDIENKYLVIEKG